MFLLLVAKIIENYIMTCVGSDLDSKLSEKQDPKQFRMPNTVFTCTKQVKGEGGQEGGGPQPGERADQEQGLRA